MTAQVGQLTSVAAEVGQELGYSDIEFFAKGAFKETYRARSTDGTIVALKLVDRTKIEYARTEREISALRRCSSPRIATVLHTSFFKGSDGRHFDVVVEEFFSGGTLEDRLYKSLLSRSEILELARGVTDALDVLHRLQLVHRDIKPANIMFREDSPLPVLVDFGIVRDLSESSLTLTWLPQGPGTPFFASPEQLNNEKSMIDWRTDQFSLGVVLSICLTGRHPFQFGALNPHQVVQATGGRQPLAPEFIEAVKVNRLQPIGRMVRPWPVQRYPTPRALGVELQNLE